MRANRTILGMTLVGLLLAGCGADDDRDDRDDGDDRGPDSESSAPATVLKGTFEKYSSKADAVSYDTKAVPDGATAELRVTEEKGDGTEFELGVAGLRPDRVYGAHVHTKPCGAKPDDAGPHYQDKADPKQPSVDPKYANDDNEVWLDLTTDADGGARTDSDVDWLPRKDQANSLVLHAEHTMTGPGHAGMAGDRLACMNISL